VSGNPESPWRKLDPANDNAIAPDRRGNRTQARSVICDLPHSPGIIEGEAELLARFFDVIESQLEAANDNETSGED